MSESLPLYSNEKPGFQTHHENLQPKGQCFKRRLLVALTLAGVLTTSLIFLREISIAAWQPGRTQSRGSTQQGIKGFTANDFFKHVKRAAGDQYLLGVGKADITGQALSSFVHGL